VTKLETWLRMAGIQYEARPLDRPPGTRTGKIPFVDLPDGTRVEDSARIQGVLTAQFDIRLDHGLTEDEQARAIAIQRLVEDSLYYAVAWLRWQDPAGYALTRRDYFLSLPFPMRPPMAWWLRRTVLNNLHGQGFGREERSFVVERALRDVTALSALIGEGPWVLGGEPRGIDASVFGSIANIRHAPYTHELSERVRGDARLCSWEERMRERYWPDWNELPA